jgi:hypothetical protein
MKATPAACAAIALAFPISAWADLNMRPGLWESSMTVGGNAMPVEQKCYMQKDIDALDRFQRGAAQPAETPCSTADYKALGNTMTYTLTCQFNGKKSISAVTTTYDGERITGTIAGIDGTISKLVNIRIGDCSESSFGN